MNWERRAWPNGRKLYLSLEQEHYWAKKSKNLQTDRKPNILWWQASGRKAKMMGRGGNLGHPNVIFCYFFFLHYDKISLVVRSPHHALTPLPCWSRLNKGKNPSSSCEGRARIKIMEYNPKRLPLKWIFHPFIFMTGIVNLPQKLRTTVHLSLPTLPLREYNRLLSTSPYPTMACL